MNISDLRAIKDALSDASTNTNITSWWRVLAANAYDAIKALEAERDVALARADAAEADARRCREEFEAWCKRNCSPHAEQSAWYWTIWRAGQSAALDRARSKEEKSPGG